MFFLIKSSFMNTRRGYIVLSITILLWGTAFMINKLVLQEVAPLQLTLIRTLLAFMFMAPMAARQGFKLRDIFRREFMLFGLTGTTLYYALQNIGLTYTTVSSTALILAILPATTTVLAVIFLKERLTRIQIGGIVLATIGVILVSLDSGDTSPGSNPILGNLLIFGAALSWSIYTVQGRNMSGNYPSMVMSAASAGAGAILLLPFVGWEIADQGLAHISGIYWLGILYLGLVVSGLSTYLWNEALHHLSASVASSYSNLVTIIGVASSFLLGERPPLVQIFGGAVAILGVLLSSRSSKLGKSDQFE